MEHLKCLRALFLTNPQDDLAAIRSAKGDRVDDTCDWVLTQHQYTSWLVEESPQLLWLSGAPGIGKTMIASFLVEELTPIAERTPQMTLAYYFCDDKRQERRTATAILRGLLLQVLRQRPILFKYIQESFEMSRDSLFKNFHALWRIFVAIVNDPEVGEVCCLVDALDECEKDSRQLFLFGLKKLYCSQQSNIASVKFIITSRRDNEIVESLSAVSPAIWHLQIDSGKVNHDVSKFINTKVNELSALKGYSAGLKKDIKRALTDKAGGTFLYVSLVLSLLKRTRAQSLVREKLESLPEDLNNLYDKILSQIDQDCAEIAIFVFRWVAVATRPLTVKELAMARALSEWKTNKLPPDDHLDELKDIFKCCEPLVTLDTDHDTINLVHQSAKDYLLGAYLQEKRGLSQYHVIPESTNLLMFRTCWKFLSFEEFKQGTILIDRGAYRYLDKMSPFWGEHFFHRYALPQWQKHAIAASPALAIDSRFWKTNLAESPTLRDALLLGAAARGGYVIVQRLLENGAQINSRDEHKSTPFLLASREGHEKVLELLLERGNAGINSPNIDGLTPLHEAAAAGHTAVVKLLLSHDDIAVNSQDQNGDTPLSCAAWNGHEAVVKLLLSHDDIAVNSQDKNRDTPLLCAVWNGYEVVVKLLLSHDDITVNSQNKNGDTPLLWAASNGYEAVVKLLLSHDDIVVNSQDDSGRIPLLYAAGRGHKRVARLLLSRDDIAVNFKDRDGRTPLLYAAWKGHEAVVKLLLNHNGIVVNSQDDSGRTPLFWAVEYGHERVIRLLLSRDDIDVNIRDNEGRTALA